MPSPFPGMDPYLEAPNLWPGVHGRLIPLIAEVLNRQLPTGYIADIEERVYIAGADRTLRPDVAVLETLSVERREAGGVATLAAPSTDVPFVVQLEEVRETLVRILALRGSEERVVTAIEVLSPTNKTPGIGRDQYKAKSLLRTLIQHQVVFATNKYQPACYNLDAYSVY